MKVISRFPRLIALLLITTMFIPNLVISVAATSEVQLSKVTVVDTSSDGRTFDVAFTINVEPTYVEPSDIVIVLDRSNSMLNEIPDTNKYIVHEVKNATIAFIEQVMAVPGNRIAIVGYGSDANVYNNYNYYTSATSAINAVNHLLATRTVTYKDEDYYYRRYGYDIRWSNFAYDKGATNIQAGLQKAEVIVENSDSSTNKAVVLFTDGEANRESSSETSDPVEAAILQADYIKAIPNTTIYSMGYFAGLYNPSTAINTLNEIDSSGQCKNAPTTEELENIFSDINSVINNIGTSAIVNETLNVGFEIVEGSILASIGTVTTANNNTSFNWNIGTIGKGTYTLNMKIRVLDTAYVAGQDNVLTSITSTLTYTDINDVVQTINFPENYVNIPPLGKFKDLAITTRDNQSIKYVNTASETIEAKVAFTTLRDFKLIQLKLADNYPDQEYAFILETVKDLSGNIISGFTSDADEIIYSGTNLPMGTYYADIVITSPTNYLTAVDLTGNVIVHYDMEVVQVITQEVAHTYSSTYPATSEKLRIQYNEGPSIRLTPSTLNFTSSVVVDADITGFADIVEYKCLRGDLTISDFSTTANGYGLHSVDTSNPKAITAQFTVQATGVDDPINGIYVKNDYYTVYAKDITGKETVSVIRINNLLLENPDLL